MIKLWLRNLALLLKISVNFGVVYTKIDSPNDTLFIHCYHLAELTQLITFASNTHELCIDNVYTNNITVSARFIHDTLRILSIFIYCCNIIAFKSWKEFNQLYASWIYFYPDKVHKENDLFLSWNGSNSNKKYDK